MTEAARATLRYLSRQDVVECCATIDVVAATDRALAAHARGGIVLPPEAYLSWETPDGHAARVLAMPGALLYEPPIVGVKVINSSLGNWQRGLPRAHGLTLLADPQTAEPLAILEGAEISALRTAAMTASTLRALGPAPLRRVAILGCGTVGAAHLKLLPHALPSIAEVTLYDVRPEAALALARSDEVACSVAGGPEEACADAQAIVLATTATTGYVRFEWIAPGALVANVSLDDVLPEVVQRAGLLLVDDWDLVRQDVRRLLGRMFRAGTVLAPNGSAAPGVVPAPQARRVDGTVGDVIVGRLPGRRCESDVVLTNPFGMSLLDIAIAVGVFEVAERRGLGLVLPR